MSNVIPFPALYCQSFQEAARQVRQTDGYQSCLTMFHGLLNVHIAAFEDDPPVGQFQQDYLRALRDLDCHVGRKMSKA